MPWTTEDGRNMQREEIEQYEGKRVKLILKGTGNIYSGTILKLYENSFVILDKFNNEVTIDYEMCGLVSPLGDKQ